MNRMLYATIVTKRAALALLLAGVVWLAGSSPAAAQIDTAAAVVRIPFSFIAGNRLLPAGNYRIAPETPDWSVVTVTNVNGPEAAFVATEGAPGAAKVTVDSQVKFVSYFGQHFLQQIAVPGRDAREVVITRAEAERTLAKLNLMSAEPASATK